MQSSATTVDEYMETVPEERRDALVRLRELCLSVLVGYDEVMSYGMPGYANNGIGEVAFNSQKQYISLYILDKAVLDRHRDKLKDTGKGCIRYRKPTDIYFSNVEQLLKETAASSSEICP